MDRPRDRRPTPTARRRGIASLELVLSLPFLLLMTAIIYAFGQASLAGSSAALQARQRAWKGPEPPPGSRPFRWADRPGGDLWTGRGERDFRVSRALPGIDTRAHSRASVLAGTWDHREVPFEPERAFVPHMGPLRLLVRGAADGVPTAAVAAIDGIGGFGNLGRPGSSLMLTSDVGGTMALASTLDDLQGEVPSGGSGDSELARLAGNLQAILPKGGGGVTGGLGDLIRQGAEKLGLPGKEVGALTRLLELSGEFPQFAGRAEGLDLSSLKGGFGIPPGLELHDSMADAQYAALESSLQMVEGLRGAIRPTIEMATTLADLSTTVLRRLGFKDEHVATLEKYVDEFEKFSEQDLDNLMGAARGK